MSRALYDVSFKTLLAMAIVTALAACNREPPAQAADTPAPAASAAPAIAAAPYQRPTADQLYALVAPIALFPDNLVAQTLAASTHPDQVDDARQFVQGHRDLTGGALLDAADTQPWDPSVKSLVAFPAVLDQMANNGEWTDALGQAYANQPSDVMNAIQVMRSRAQAHGNLKTNAKQTVQVVDRGAPVSQTVVEEDEIVGPPAQTIEIAPADSGVVYVPEYDPDQVYGGPVYSTVYETRYVEPDYGYRDAAVAGVVAFGAGILVGELFAHHEHHDRPYGWDSWHTSWGGRRDGGRPAVVYDNHPYVVNRTVVNNRFVDRSVHIDNRHDFNNVNMRPGAPPREAAAPRPAQPDFAHMQRPTFAPAMTHPTAPNARPALPPPQANDPRAAAFQRDHGMGRNPAQAGAPGVPGAPVQGRPEQGPRPGMDIAHTNPNAAPHPTPHAPTFSRPGADTPRGQPFAPRESQQAHAMPAPAAAPAVRNEPQRATPQQAQAPRAEPQPQRAQPQRMEQPRPQPQRFEPRQPEQARVEAPQRDAPRPEPQQHFQQAPREMPREMPRPQPPREEPRPQPQQQHHEQARPAPQQQPHHDDHKKHDN
ncbi:DUF3300 domain-containing protein [Luteibacter pinisoli]|uniref:DUF3300 domain-containing protein n=1 Tax=Luteibacter pinisoli TaxID=2589080 RepID=A0A4Y5Z076_9GAMM|nr:DUF3300 domain-containing protein [Luteibacter pinisoli]QDE38561.1 DUF3300 domain-containing protein [Luteibacter pinisoli]